MWRQVLALTLFARCAAASAVVDVNSASVADLDGVKGIGPAVSARILDERNKADFKDWNDFVSRVKGIGPGSARRFSAEGLTVNGVALGETGAAAVGPASNASASASTRQAGGAATETRP